MVEVSDGMLCRELIFMGRVRIWRAEDKCVVKRMIPLKYPLLFYTVSVSLLRRRENNVGEFYQVYVRYVIR